MLKQDLVDQQEIMAQMVTRDKAKQVGKIMHEKGQLRGKQELERNLAFPWLPERTVPFSELKDAYLKSLTNNRPEGGTKKPPTEKILQEYDRTIGFFATVMGDCHIGTIDRAIVGEYFGILKRLPANMSRKAAYRNKTIPELLAMEAKPQEEGNCSTQIIH